MQPVSIVPLAGPYGQEMDALLSLYERAIPSSERRSGQAVRELTGSAAHRLSVLKQGQDVLGFSILFIGARVGLLEYLAVDERCRGLGFGTMLYRDARLRLGGRPLLVEVESDGADEGESRRRMTFYRRLGCRRLEGLGYILPLITDAPPPPLDLLVDGHGAATIDAAELREWLEHIYVGAYGCKPDDPRLDSMLAGQAIRLD